MAETAHAERKGSSRQRPWLVLLGAAAAGVLVGGAMSWFKGGPIEDFGEPESLIENMDEEMLVGTPSFQRRQVPAEPPTSIAGLPVYPGTFPQFMADATSAKDVPMSLAWFSTQDSPDDVAQWYQDRLLEAGLVVVGERMGPDGGYIGYRHPETGHMHVVTLMGMGTETMGLISAASAERLMEVETRVPEVLPHPPHAEGTMVISMVEGDRLQRSIYATVPGNIPDLVGFYRRAFTERGWIIERVVGDMFQTARIDARGQRHTVQVVMQEEPRDIARAVALYVLLIGDS